MTDAQREALVRAIGAAAEMEMAGAITMDEAQQRVKDAVRGSGQIKSDGEVRDAITTNDAA